jgi:hypothetical protein
MCSTITVQLDAVEALAAELGVLAAELGDEADLCRSTARSFPAALPGHEGWTAGAAATAWGSLATVVAARTSAVAVTLTGATAAYRAADAALSEGIGAREHGVLEGPR